MASPVHQGRKAIRFVSQTLEGLAVLDLELERVGGVEKLLAEKQAELAEVQTVLDGAAAEKAEAQKILAEAKAEAEVIIAEAKAEATRVGKETALTSDKLKNLNMLLDERKGQLAQYNGEIAALRSKLV